MEILSNMKGKYTIHIDLFYYTNETTYNKNVNIEYCKVFNCNILLNTRIKFA